MTWRNSATMWRDTSTVDPVLARMIHMLRVKWEPDSRDARALEDLDAVVAGTRGDDTMSARRAMFVVNRGLRGDLPQLLRSASRARTQGPSGPLHLAADELEQSDPVTDTGSAGRLVTITYHLERRVDGVDRGMMHNAWFAAYNAEMAIFNANTYRIGSSAVGVMRILADRRVVSAEMGAGWEESEYLSRRLALEIVREAATVRSEDPLTNPRNGTPTPRK